MPTNTINYNNSSAWIPAMPSPPPTPAPPEAALTTQERLRLAKRRRATQLKRWNQRDREKSAVGGGGGAPPDLIPRGVGGVHDRVEFVPNVMLLEASARNDVEEVRRLLRLGVSPDSTNEDGLTALHQCCIDDSEEMMKILIEFGGNPNATDTEKWTPLHAAATCGHLHLVKFLIEHGADLLAVNADGNMPYDLCDDDTTLSYIENEMAKRGVTQDLIDTTRAETERKMIIDLKTCDSSDLFEVRDPVSGATPLHIAAANGYMTVVEFLLDNHVSTEVIDNDQWQPIHAAACWGHLEVVEMLAQNGANISAKTKNGETPFDICEDPEIKERLIQLKEQRVRLEQPRVRRTRSASTRTQSIRRTSLREKMNTTKKDVQDEKLYFIQSFDAIPKTEDQHKHRGSGDNADVVDLNDVELMLPGGPSSPESPVPKRPPRSNLRDSPEKSLSSLTSTGGGQRPVTSSSSSSPSDKINIHVSVTINAPPSGPGSATTTTPSSSQLQHHQALPGGQQHHPQQQQLPPGPSGGTTLADLKKARSMNRSINAYGGSPATSSPSMPTASSNAPPTIPSSSSSFSEHHHHPSSPREEAPPMAANANASSSPSRHHHHSSSGSRGHRGGSSSAEETMGPVIDHGVELHSVGGGGHKGSSRRKYTATTTELIGPDKKKGCCTII